MIKKFWPIFILFFIFLIFFWQSLVKGYFPIPSDTIVGLYYPFRDIYSKTNPNGLPFKNFLITDPVRQTYPWRNLSIAEFKSFNLPLWNPYNFAGTPLLANFQSAVFYPFNLFFFIFPFAVSWSILIFLQPLLAGIFIYFYLDHLKLRKLASFLGAVAFSLSGFFIAWMEWGTVLNSALWLPLILLSIDKTFECNKYRQFLIWQITFTSSLIFSFFGGHLQTFFYIAIFSAVYIIARWFQKGKNLKILISFLFFSSLFVLLTFVQWLPTLLFILQSARNADTLGIRQPGWFIPWQNLIQFVAPDFFGNPSTLNYFGIWNYAEFVGYIGMFPLIMAFLAIVFRKDRKTLFFGSALFVSLLFSLPNIISLIPFRLQIPFISTSQPTRLIFISDFSLSVLAALGFDYYLKNKNKRIFYIIAGFALIFVSLWIFVFFYHGNFVSVENIKVSRQNLILPTALFILIAILLMINALNIKFARYILYVLILITVCDLFRFGWKFESFSDKKYLFPNTQVTSYIKSQKGNFRVISTDSTIFPPNFSIIYKIQTLEGYDPLYLNRFGQLMAAVKRGKPDISSPFGFNRIITIQNYSSPILDLLNVKYFLATKVLSDSKLQKVFESGSVKIYENKSYLQRTFFLKKTIIKDSKQDAINALFNIKSFQDLGIVEGVNNKSLFKKEWGVGVANITFYSENKVTIKTKNKNDGFLILTDAYYPSWHAKIDGKETKIYITDFAFRGIIVPKGNHIIEFYNTIF